MDFTNEKPLSTHSPFFKLSKQIIDSLLASSKQRLNYIFHENEDFFCAATFLDFKFKKFTFIKDKNLAKRKMNKAQEYIRNIYIQNKVDELVKVDKNDKINPRTNNNNNNNNNNCKKNNTASEFINKLRDKASVYDRDSLRESTFDSDIRKYLLDDAYDAFEGTDDYRSTLEYYQNFEFAFPGLSYVARLILHVSASSVPSECLFSHVGLIYTPLRNRLNYKNLEHITYIRENMRTIDFKL